MAIVTRTREPHNPEFVSAGDDYLKEYIKEIDRPKQQQSIPELPEDSDFTELEEMIPEVKEPSQYAQKRGKTTARFAVGTVDKIIASMVAVYAHSDSPKVFRADDEDIEDLAEQWGV
jgi:aspartyl aminopeptidase